ARPALRHRSCRSPEVGHADARELVLGLRVPEFQLSPGAPLLRRRSVLPAAGAAARADALLPAPRDALAQALRPVTRLVPPQPSAAHQLGGGTARDEPPDRHDEPPSGEHT